MKFSASADSVDAFVTSYTSGSFSSTGTTNLVLVTAHVHVLNYTASSFTVTVLRWSPIRILTQPSTQDAFIGGKASFNVSAVAESGNALKYRWRKNGVKIGGATNRLYNISSVASTSVGAYTVAITNNLGEITSSVASINLIPNP